jgi:hypothetical protein
MIRPACFAMNKKVHLFFGCIVALYVWVIVSELLNLNLGATFESIARLWVANSCHGFTNVVTFVVMWMLWKLRNELCF